MMGKDLEFLGFYFLLTQVRDESSQYRYDAKRGTLEFAVTSGHIRQGFDRSTQLQ
jgi:hypothetical protein